LRNNLTLPSYWNAHCKGLSPDHRAVLELTYDLGHSCGEIAAIMDCPVNTVKTRMFHARNKLRRLVPILAAPGGEARRIPASH
jgi:DNA-directed RNA polymerase specialized sigma24 family protein